MGNVLSLKDLLDNKYSYLQDKVFEIDLQDDLQNSEVDAHNFKYVQIKMKKIKSTSLKASDKKKKRNLIQIINISDKILYNEVKAENFFATLINAAISHELRNPLNSLISQFPHLGDLFDIFDSIINTIKN